jgi:hypothetical protein
MIYNNLSNRWRWVFSCRPRSHYPQGMNPGTHRLTCQTFSYVYYCTFHRARFQILDWYVCNFPKFITVNLDIAPYSNSSYNGHSTIWDIKAWVFDNIIKSAVNKPNVFTFLKDNHSEWIRSKTSISARFRIVLNSTENNDILKLKFCFIPKYNLYLISYIYLNYMLIYKMYFNRCYFLEYVVRNILWPYSGSICVDLDRHSI